MGNRLNGREFVMAAVPGVDLAEEALTRMGTNGQQTRGAGKEVIQRMMNYSARCAPGNRMCAKLSDVTDFFI